MDELLRNLLDRLQEIGQEHEEIYDTECRERMSNAILNGFIRPLNDFSLASDFGLYSSDANARVREALGTYISEANKTAKQINLCCFHARLSAFQNETVRSKHEGVYYDDFFGYWRPESYSEKGEKIG
jgi:hypothetical protein